MGMLLAMTMNRLRKEAQERAENAVSATSEEVEEEIPFTDDKPVEQAKKPAKRGGTRRRVSK